LIVHLDKLLKRQKGKRQKKRKRKRGRGAWAGRLGHQPTRPGRGTYLLRPGRWAVDRLGDWIAWAAPASRPTGPRRSRARLGLLGHQFAWAWSHARRLICSCARPQRRARGDRPRRPLLDSIEADGKRQISSMWFAASCLVLQATYRCGYKKGAPDQDADRRIGSAAVCVLSLL
jgi:hypothetical protein